MKTSTCHRLVGRFSIYGQKTFLLVGFGQSLVSICNTDGFVVFSFHIRRTANVKSSYFPIRFIFERHTCELNFGPRMAKLGTTMAVKRIVNETVLRMFRSQSSKKFSRDLKKKTPVLVFKFTASSIFKFAFVYVNFMREV